MRDLKGTVPSAPMEIIAEAPLLEVDSSRLADTVVVTAVAVDASKPDCEQIEIFSQLWDYPEQNEFLQALKSSSNEDAFELIQYLKKFNMLETFKQQKILNWIQNDSNAKMKFQLFELRYLAKQYQLHSEKIKYTEPHTSTDLVDLSLNILKLIEGIELIQNSENAINATFENKTRIFQLHIQFLENFADIFEKFKKEHPGILNFNSLLKYSNGQNQHILVELKPRYQPQSTQTSRVKLDETLRQEYLHLNVKMDGFASMVNKNKQYSKFFLYKNDKEKNLLHATLETKDSKKISAVAKAIFDFNDEERKEILNSKLKDYRLTGFTQSADLYLHMLELERLILRLESFSKNDPNVHTLRELFESLKKQPDNPRGLIEQARNDLRRNTTWWNWLFGSYGSTGYGVGIFKSTFISLLNKLEKSVEESKELLSPNRCHSLS